MEFALYQLYHRYTDGLEGPGGITHVIMSSTEKIGLDVLRYGLNILLRLINSEIFIYTLNYNDGVSQIALKHIQQNTIVTLGLALKADPMAGPLAASEDEYRIHVSKDVE